MPENVALKSQLYNDKIYIILICTTDIRIHRTHPYFHQTNTSYHIYNAHNISADNNTFCYLCSM